VRKIDPPKPAKPILPGLTSEQVNYLINYVNSLRDRAIIYLFADSGMRLSKLANIRACDIDWGDCAITIWGKGNKQRKAPFATGSAELPSKLISQKGIWKNIWNMKLHNIQDRLIKLAKVVRLPW